MLALSRQETLRAASAGVDRRLMAARHRPPPPPAHQALPGAELALTAPTRLPNRPSGQEAPGCSAPHSDSALSARPGHSCVTNGGKTTLAEKLKKILPNCDIISQDDFFKLESEVETDQCGFKLIRW
ncbi:uncharacterized protein [Struthio camelus]|uniref:uncharacterized protein isoform X1 n=1 Tax=Struthio camelus TaxID=8801 RepID=UPI003603DDBC